MRSKGNKKRDVKYHLFNDMIVVAKITDDKKLTTVFLESIVEFTFFSLAVSQVATAKVMLKNAKIVDIADSEGILNAFEVVDTVSGDAVNIIIDLLEFVLLQSSCSHHRPC